MFRCKDLFTLSSLPKLRLLAGEQGLHKGIRWAYKAESINLSDWVHGGELLIISKMVTSEPGFDLYTFLSDAIALKMTGALILVGPNYIEKIPQKILHLCDEHKFPLFAMPWNTPLVDFFEEMGHAITISDSNQYHGEGIIYSIIFENNTPVEELIREASEIGYNINSSSCFFILHCNISDQYKTYGLNQMIRDNIREFLQLHFLTQHIPAVLSGFGSNIVGLVSCQDETKKENTTPDFRLILPQILRNLCDSYPELTINIGVGMPESRPQHLKKSYEQASTCIGFCTKRNLSQQIQYYEQLGLYQLFMDLNCPEILDTFVRQNLGALLSYDLENHTQMLDTLDIYLQENCNILHTADRLFTHRNTIKYRLSRIEEILGCSLEDSSARLNLHVAIYIHRFIL